MLWKQRTVAEKHVKHAEAAQLVMAPIIQSVVPHFPSRVWEDTSAQFCTTFWSLTMYDIHVPEHLYAKEIKKLKEAPAKLIDNKDLNSTRRKKEAEWLNNQHPHHGTTSGKLYDNIFERRFIILNPG